MAHPVPRRNRLVLLGGIAGAVLRGELRIGAPRSLETLARIILRTLPEVSSVSPPDLREMMTSQRVVLLDCRSPQEHRLSHIAGAIRVDPDMVTAPEPLPVDARIVCYCAIGVRSMAYAAALVARGLAPASRCFNLSGGIFAWHNQRLPLVDADGPTTVVHPYSRLWRPMLVRGDPGAVAAGRSQTGERGS